MPDLQDLEKRVTDLEATKAEVDSSDTGNLRFLLITELSAALRARSEPEHLYTAAAVGAFGAVAWGVATLQPEKYFDRASYLRPAGVAAIGTLLVAAAIVVKIVREYCKYAATKEALADIATALDQVLPDVIPENIKSKKAGKGYIFSLAVVGVGAAAAILFCISVIGPIG